MTITSGKFTKLKAPKTNHSFFGKKEPTNRLFFQPKLTIGPVDDVYEREADAVSERVMKDGNPIENTIHPMQSQAMVQPSCSACQEDEKKIQRKKINGGIEKGNPLPLVNQTIQSQGHSLDEGAKSFMERKIGYDFSKVNIHTGSDAAKSAQSINALAYCV